MINSCFRVSCIFLTRDIVFSQGDEEGKCGGGVWDSGKEIEGLSGENGGLWPDRQRWCCAPQSDGTVAACALYDCNQQ